MDSEDEKIKKEIDKLFLDRDVYKKDNGYYSDLKLKDVKK
jgi:hypothetical protein